MGVNWNTIAAAAAAIAGFSYVGVPTAQAEPLPQSGSTGSAADCTTGGAKAERTETNGSTALHTSPSTVVEQRRNGPQVSPDMVWLIAD